MSHGPDLDVWRNVVPEEAVRHNFLMDGLLALSALHLAFENQETRWRYTEIAIHYQNSGLRQYTDALKQITVDNSHALFAYAIITTILALALPGSCQETDVPSCIESLVSMFELLQGISIISQASGGSLRTGKFGLLFREVPLELERPVPAPNVVDAMVNLRKRAGSVAKYVEPGRLEVYLSGIDSLELVFGSVVASKYLGCIMAWPATINGKLLELFKRSDPMAQLIFLHYSVLLLYTHDRWWGRNFGLRIIKGLTASISAIDPEWASCTGWVSDNSALMAQGSWYHATQQNPSPPDHGS
jgi:hypothetical protein